MLHDLLNQTPNAIINCKSNNKMHKCKNRNFVLAANSHINREDGNKTLSHKSSLCKVHTWKCSGFRIDRNEHSSNRNIHCRK